MRKHAKFVFIVEHLTNLFQHQRSAFSACPTGVSRHSRDRYSRHYLVGVLSNDGRGQAEEEWWEISRGKLFARVKTAIYEINEKESEITPATSTSFLISLSFPWTPFLVLSIVPGECYKKNKNKNTMMERQSRTIYVYNRKSFLSETISSCIAVVSTDEEA